MKTLSTSVPLQRNGEGRNIVYLSSNIPCFEIKTLSFTGQSMKAEAIVSGNPYPTVRWYNGNDEITDGGRYKITVSEPNTVNVLTT